MRILNKIMCGLLLGLLSSPGVVQAEDVSVPDEIQQLLDIVDVDKLDAEVLLRTPVGAICAAALKILGDLPLEKLEKLLKNEKLQKIILKIFTTTVNIIFHKHNPKQISDTEQDWDTVPMHTHIQLKEEAVEVCGQTVVLLNEHITNKKLASEFVKLSFILGIQLLRIGIRMGALGLTFL